MADAIMSGLQLSTSDSKAERLAVVVMLIRLVRAKE
ncbi:hypothetical protein BH24ACI5_BH24ACI5_02840 [soil metagenome]